VKFFKAIRYGSLGIMASTIFVAIQGCDLREGVIALLVLLALLLPGLGGDNEIVQVVQTAHIAVLKVQADVDINNNFFSQTVTMKAVVTNPGQVSSYAWDFGDGGDGSGETVTHTTRWRERFRSSRQYGGDER